MSPDLRYSNRHGGLVPLPCRQCCVNRILRNRCAADCRAGNDQGRNERTDGLHHDIVQLARRKVKLRQVGVHILALGNVPLWNVVENIVARRQWQIKPHTLARTVLAADEAPLLTCKERFDEHCRHGSGTSGTRVRFPPPPLRRAPQPVSIQTNKARWRLPAGLACFVHVYRDLRDLATGASR